MGDKKLTCAASAAFLRASLTFSEEGSSPPKVLPGVLKFDLGLDFAGSGARGGGGAD